MRVCVVGVLVCVAGSWCLAAGRQAGMRSHTPCLSRCLLTHTQPPSPSLLSQGLSPEVREVSAEGLGELVGLTSEEGLKPFVVTITGPLIRIIGDK